MVGITPTPEADEKLERMLTSSFWIELDANRYSLSRGPGALRVVLNAKMRLSSWAKPSRLWSYN